MYQPGDVPAGSTLYIPFDTYGKTNPGSITASGLATTDIEIYKNGSTTQRASDNGYSLPDTDGIDFDGLTGIHGINVDLSDNSDSGFYAVGSSYRVVVSSITVDGETVNFTAAIFRISAAEAIAGKPKVDVDGWNGTAVAIPDTAGYPKTTSKVGTGTGEFQLSSGVVRANDSSNNAIAPAATALSTAQWTSARAGYLDEMRARLAGNAVANESAKTVTFYASDGTTASVVLRYFGDEPIVQTRRNVT
jgi:hypothetical protein